MNAETSIKAARPVTRNLDALPEALRTNVLSYAARKWRTASIQLERDQRTASKIFDDFTAQVRALGGEVAEVGESITIKGREAIETLFATTPNPAISYEAELEKIIRHEGLVEAGSALAQDKPLIAIFSDLVQHYKGNIPPELFSEAAEHVVDLQSRDPKTFLDLSKIKIVPTIAPAEPTVIYSSMQCRVPEPEKMPTVKPGSKPNLLKDPRVAFVAIAGVAVGAVMHKMLLAEKHIDRSHSI